MFNWGQVWWHWSPIQNSNIVIWNKLLCDSSFMCPSTILLQDSVSFGTIVLHEYVSYIKGTRIFANTFFTYTLAFTLRLKTTRRVLLCRVIPPHTCMDPPVTSSVLTFPLPAESCPVDDSLSSAGHDVVDVDVVVLAFGGLFRSLFGGRVVPGALLSIHSSLTLLQCFVWFNPLWAHNVLCFFHFLRNMAWPYRNVFNIN